MAYSDVPTDWIPGYAATTTTITLPIESAGHFSEISSAEADASTGDIRQILFGLCHGSYESWNAIAVADRPNRMTISKSISTNVATGIATNTFTLRFENTVSGTDVADEEV